MKTANIKKELARYARELATEELVVGSDGNISAREGNRIFIKKSGTGFKRAKSEDFINIRDKKQVSAEWRIHLNCYKARPARFHEALLYRAVEEFLFQMGESSDILHRIELHRYILYHVTLDPEEGLWHYMDELNRQFNHLSGKNTMQIQSDSLKFNRAIAECA